MKVSVVLISEDNLALLSLRQQLDKENSFSVEGKVRSFEEAFELLRLKTSPVIVLVDLSRDSDKAFKVAREIKLKLPNVHLVMSSPDNNPEIIIKAMRAGAEEFLTQPFNLTEVVKSLERIRDNISLQSARAADVGRIITVFSNKGGVGSTTVTTNLAVALAAKKNSVCIVDLVLQFGSVTSFLNLEPYYTILDLIKNMERVDPLLLEGSLVKHTSGVRVLAEPFYAEDARTIEPADIDQILMTLRQSFDFVVVDTPKEVDEGVSIAFERADLILFVTEMDIPSLRTASRAFDLFERKGMQQKKIRLVLNRHIKSKLISLESVEKTLGLKVFWALPNDYPTAIAALNQGISIHEADSKSELSKSYRSMADAVMEAITVSESRRRDEEAKKTGVLSRWISALKTE